MESPRFIAKRLDADRFKAADAMTFEQRALGGVVMFDLLTEVMRAGIRLQYSEADDATVARVLRERLRIARARERNAP